MSSAFPLVSVARRGWKLLTNPSMSCSKRLGPSAFDCFRVPEIRSIFQLMSVTRGSMLTSNYMFIVGVNCPPFFFFFLLTILLPLLSGDTFVNYDFPTLWDIHCFVSQDNQWIIFILFYDLCPGSCLQWEPPSVSQLSALPSLTLLLIQVSGSVEFREPLSNLAPILICIVRK